MCVQVLNHFNDYSSTEKPLAQMVATAEMSVRKLAISLARRSCTRLVGWMWSIHTSPPIFLTSPALNPNATGLSSKALKNAEDEYKNVDVSLCPATNALSVCCKSEFHALTTASTLSTRFWGTLGQVSSVNELVSRR